MSRVITNLAKLAASATSPPISTNVPLVNLTPKPAKFPGMPGPGKTNMGTSMAKGPGAPKSDGGAGVGINTGSPGGSGGLTSTASYQKHAFLEAGILPLILGAGAGIGGYHLADKYLSPRLSTNSKVLAEVAGQSKGVKKVPALAGALSAYIVGSIAAKSAREDERRKLLHAINVGATRSYTESGYQPQQQSRFLQDMPLYD